MTPRPSRDDMRRRILAVPGEAARYLADINEVFSMFDPAELGRLMARADLLRTVARGRSPEAATARHMAEGRRQRAAVTPRTAEVPAVTVDGCTLRFFSGDGPGRVFFDRVMPRGAVHEVGVIRLLRDRLAAEDVVVDVGAHVGFLACFAARFGATVLALEMQPALTPMIAANAMLNELWRVHSICAAAGERAGLVQSMRVVASPGLMAYSERTDAVDVRAASVNHDIVPRLRLDDLCFDGGEAPAWIKIDVEGAEGLVLAGARQLIAAGRTRFIVELHSHRYAAFGTSAEEILDLFDPARWRFGRIRDDGSVEAMDRAAFLAHDSRSEIEDQLLFEPVTA